MGSQSNVKASLKIAQLLKNKQQDEQDAVYDQYAATNKRHHQGTQKDQLVSVILMQLATPGKHIMQYIND